MTPGLLDNVGEQTHECPAPGCTQRMSMHLLACRPHWFMLPLDMRRGIWSAWYGTDQAEYMDRRAEAVAWWETHA